MEEAEETRVLVEPPFRSESDPDTERVSTHPGSLFSITPCQVLVDSRWMPATTRRRAAAAAQRAQLQGERHSARANLKKESADDAKVFIEEKHRFGLVQEIYQHDLYHLIVQAILWNQTHGNKAIIVLRKLLELYPDPETLSHADEAALTALLQPIGLHRLRAKRLIALGQTWVKQPPTPGVVYKVRYKCPECESRWEIAHLPGVGKYAIDSYRIFFRDQLRGIALSWDDRHGQTRQSTDIEPEWKRVSPTDKDLRAFLVWAWSQEGFHWDPISGHVSIKSDSIGDIVA